MNKRGFTLVELLAVIVILSILLLISIPIYNNVSSSINNSAYETKVSNILAKAEEYAAETNKMIFDIKTLIKEGKLSPDNESGVLEDPRTKRDMNCDVINIKYDQNQYFATLSENDTCYSAEELESLYGIIEIKLYKEDGITLVDYLSDTEWIRESKVILKYEFKEEYADYAPFVEKIIWSGDAPKACDKLLSKECTYELSTSEIRNNKVTINVTIKKDNITFENKVSKDILIDLQAPVLVEDSIKYDTELYTANKLKIEFTLSDGEGSGIRDYAFISTPNCNSEEYEQKKKIANNPTITEYLSNGDYYLCASDKVGNRITANESQKIQVNTVDETKPAINSFSIQKSQKGNKYYNELQLKVHVTDDNSGPKSILYCFGEEECVPDRTAPIDKEGYAYIDYDKSSKNPQKTCVIGIDRAGNASERVCSESYLFDNTPPESLYLQVGKDGNYYVNYSAVDKESDIYIYKIYLSTDNSNYSLFYEKTSNTFETTSLGKLNANTKYYIKIVFTNQAGITNEIIETLNTEINMEDTISQCNLQNGYCNNSIYIKYGDNIFAVYKQISNSIYGVNVSKNMKTSIINDFCCDQGTCNEANVYNTAWSGIYSDSPNGDRQTGSLKVYYNKLPNPTNYLNLESYSFGIISSMPNGNYIARKTIMAYYGLLDLGEYYAIYNKPYMKGLGTLLSTVTTTCMSTDHYECNNKTDNIMGIFAEDGVLRTQSAVTGANKDIKTNAAMTVPFKKSIKFTGGNGTLENPFTI